MSYSETEHLSRVVSCITDEIQGTEQEIETKKADIAYQKKYMRDSHGDMDDEEFLQNMQTVNDETVYLKAQDRRLQILNRQMDNPYFGKVSFRYEGDMDETIFYVGMNGYTSDDIPEDICDWRAPVSSLYYDYEKGSASYMAPDGEMTGEIMEKKQFDIRHGRLYMSADTDEALNDTMLLQALSGNSRTRMGQVVATIQKEQNKIIRDTTTHHLVVDGRAGSGKTVIAMHRLAWLLYNHGKLLNTSNVMILSPNSIFSDYISDVLPEIGEDNVPEKEFDLMMEEMLFIAEEYETKLMQADRMIASASDTKGDMMRIRVKSSIDFYKAFNAYLEDYTAHIAFKRFRFQGVEYEAEQIEKMFRDRFGRYPVYERFDKIAYFIADRVEDNDGKEFSEMKKRKLQETIRSEMIYRFACRNLVQLYIDFLQTYEEKCPGISAYTTDDGLICYEDILPIFYLQIYFYGCDTYKNIKHLVIDEMQDYNIFQFAVIGRIFDCKKTILGDRYQVLFYDEHETVTDIITEALGEKGLKTYSLDISYRSTAEITDFCNKILEENDMAHRGKQEAVQINRHGRAPMQSDMPDIMRAADYIARELWAGDLEDYDNVAILCDDAGSAYECFRLLSRDMDVKLLTEDSVVYTGGIVVLPKFLAKGMEFDVVFVVNSGAEIHNAIYRRAYYISCTRALHELYVIDIKD